MTKAVDWLVGVTKTRSTGIKKTSGHNFIANTLKMLRINDTLLARSALLIATIVALAPASAGAWELARVRVRPALSMINFLQLRSAEFEKQNVAVCGCRLYM